MDFVFHLELPNGNWRALSQLYLNAGMGHKSEQRLETVFARSAYQSFLTLDGELAGAARAFSDGGDCAVVCDVCISKLYQGKGLGYQLMEHLLAQIPAHERLMLFCTPGLERFYASFGFGKMTTGMCVFKDQADAIASGYIQSVEGGN